MEMRACQTETGKTLATSDTKIEVRFMTTTRFFCGGLLVVLAAVCLVVLAKAQSIPDEVRLVRPDVRLISPEEGEAIVQTAWELRRGLLPKPDCWHFVHAIYSRAGFAYDYAQAADLFDDIASFRRVKKPQPGDLVVWQGHAGIVVDPSEHSFYSSVPKGFALEDYRSNYWAARGAPRFYRHLVEDARGAQLPSPILITQPVPTTDLQSDFLKALDLHVDSPDDDAIASMSSHTEIETLVALSHPSDCKSTESRTCQRFPRTRFGLWLSREEPSSF
jgi:hypothetical protein